jgi:hypothetical protein
MFYVFRVVAATIHGKMVPAQFHTEMQRSIHLSLLPLSRDEGGREDLWFVGWATFQARHDFLPVFY